LKGGRGEVRGRGGGSIGDNLSEGWSAIGGYGGILNAIGCGRQIVENDSLTGVDLAGRIEVKC